MRIDRITLTDYRNIQSLSLDPSDRVNIIYGDNAQGKTNLLEAIWLFTGSKSFRAGKDSDFIRFQQPFCQLDMVFYAKGREQSAMLRMEREGKSKKRSFLNEIALPSVTHLAGEFCAVLFSPFHLSLVKDGPAERRRFLDTAIAQIMPRYHAVLQDYQRVLAQRNSLLRDASFHAGVTELLEVWDESFAKLSSFIMRSRHRYVQRLKDKVEEIYAGISKERERCNLRYLPCFEEDGGPAGTETLMRRLRELRGEEVRAGMTLLGPHREDLEIEIDGNSARLFASQGQQRSCVLALKLAEGLLLEEVREESPIILLDDVMSELDASRRDYLLNHLEGRQVFITCCEKAYFETLQDGRCFQMHQGVLIESPR